MEGYLKELKVFEYRVICQCCKKSMTIILPETCDVFSWKEAYNQREEQFEHIIMQMRMEIEKMKFT